MNCPNKIRLLLILPFDREYIYNSAFTKSISYAPLTLTTLAALIPEEFNIDIEIIDEGIQKPDYKNKHYDIIGITCTTSSSPRAYALSGYFKKKGAYVILGGVHPSLMPEESLNYADSIVIGYAESAFVEFLYDYFNGTPGKIYKDRTMDKLKMPVPRRELVKKKLYMSIPTIIANRSCGNNCNFCTMPYLRNKSGNKRETNEVIEEIKNLGVKNLIFLDPNITSDKEYANELFEKMIGLNVRWAGLSNLDIVEDKQLFDLVVKSGCNGLLIGFESINQNSLRETNKDFNEVKKYKDYVRELHNRNIAVLGCFVLGFDNDVKEELEKLPTIIQEIGIDLPRFSILTPFPGTQLYEKLKSEGRIITSDWSYYDTENVVYKPANMSHNELQTIFFKLWKDSFTFQKIITRSWNSSINKMLSLIFSYGFKKLSRQIIGRAKRKYDVNRFLD